MFARAQANKRKEKRDMAKATNSTNKPNTLSDVDKAILEDLQVLIEGVLNNLQGMFMSSDVHIMSEGDFEWHVANQIDIELRNNEKLNYFSVHTQVPWLCEKNKKKFLDKNKEVKDKNRRIDVVILDMTKFEPIDAKDIKQGSRYTGISFAIELKFIRPDTSVNNSGIDNDFEKRNILEEKSWLYIVPLIDDLEGGYKDKEETIKGKYEIAAEGREDIFYMPLIIHPFKERT